MIDPDGTEAGLPAQEDEGDSDEPLVAFHDAGQQPGRKVMSTLRLVHVSFQTDAPDQMTRSARMKGMKGRRQLALAQALGAIAGLFGGTFAALCGGLLTAAGWFVANDSLRQWLSMTGSVLLYLTIPLLLLGACCMDWLEKGKPQPSLKVVRPAQDDHQRN